MDCLLASLAKTLGTESTLEWLRVTMHATVPLKTASTTQNLEHIEGFTCIFEWL